MPDWSYHTLTSPILRGMPHDAGRRLVNSLLGGLASLPLGSRVIEAMGHMAPPEALRTPLGALDLSTPLVLASPIDPTGRAARAFSKFGLGALTIGPVSLDNTAEPKFEQGPNASLTGTGGPALGLQSCLELLEENRGIAFIVEIALSPDSPDFPDQYESFLRPLAGRAAAVLLSPQTCGSLQPQDPSLEQNLRHYRDTALASSLTPLLGLPESWADSEHLADLCDLCFRLGIGLYISGSPGEDGGWSWGGESPRTLAMTITIKGQTPELLLLVDGGVTEPAQGRKLVEAGADFVIISSGLVHGGPGLPKRLNHALLSLPRFAPKAVEASPPLPPERQGWFWGALLGLALLFGAGLAGWVAMTDVMLPYDEEFCGKTASEISDFNPRVLSFMVHDRVTLSGTMVSVGILYLTLSWFEIRRGCHWAQRAIQISAVSGFLSFFAFLGYGYFDPFHAMVAAILFQMLVQLIVLPAGAEGRPEPVEDLTNDADWRRGLWGQLLFIVHGAALILAGTVILTYGMTVIFVPEDIVYLGMASPTLEAFDPQLRALIAHDRATFGGMLLSAGLALLCTTLWGYRKGHRWLWWTYGIVIAYPYVQTLWIHRSIGYWDHWHLAPVYIGIVLLVAGLWASADFLRARGESSKGGSDATHRRI